MSIIGKLVGGAIGFALGGPIGAIAGAVFGHAFDKPADSEPAMSLSYGESSQITFFVATFSMLGKLARTDGQVSRAEMDAVRQFMTYDLNLSPESQQVAINIFQKAQESPESFESFASQFYGQFHVQPQMLELMMDILLRVSVSDGGIKPSEERLIQSAASIFGFSSAQYRRNSVPVCPGCEQILCGPGMHAQRHGRADQKTIPQAGFRISSGQNHCQGPAR